MSGQSIRFVDLQVGHAIRGTYYGEAYSGSIIAADTISVTVHPKDESLGNVFTIHLSDLTSKKATIKLTLRELV